MSSGSVFLCFVLDILYTDYHLTVCHESLRSTTIKNHFPKSFSVTLF